MEVDHVTRTEGDPDAWSLAIPPVYVEIDRETKRTMKYREIGGTDVFGMAACVYINKTVVEQLGRPNRLRIRIDAVPPEGPH